MAPGTPAVGPSSPLTVFLWDEPLTLERVVLSTCPEVCSWGRLPGSLPGPLSDLLSPWQPSLEYCISDLQMSPDFVVKMQFAFSFSFFLLLWGDFQEGKMETAIFTELILNGNLSTNFE